MINMVVVVDDEVLFVVVVEDVDVVVVVDVEVVFVSCDKKVNFFAFFIKR